MQRPPYIINGHAVRQSSTVRKRFLDNLSFYRILILLIPTLVLVGTNPTNQDQILEILNLRKSEESFKKKTFSFGGQSKFVFSRRITNYLFLSLEETFDGVVIHSLNKSWTCSFNDYEIGELCEDMAAKYCSRKPLIWDENDPLHTAHRILCSILLLSAVLAFVSVEHPRSCLSPSMDWVLSIFYRPNLFYDLLSANVTVYPTLEEMYRIIPKLHRGSIFSTGNYNFDFFLGVIFIIVVIGNGANMLAYKLCKRPVYGFSSVTAACLAYYQRLDRPTMYSFGGQKMTPSLLYWSFAAYCASQNITQFIAWIAAGMAGTLFANYHLENMTLFGDLSRFFGINI